LLWTIVSDDYYDYVAYEWLDVESPIIEYHPIIQGVPTEGSALTFLVSGLAGKESTETLKYHWDFGDGTTGFGAKFEHAYTRPGNYTAMLTVNDRYNMRDTVEIFVMILNAPPFTNEILQSSLEVVEGTNVVFTPNIQDSPYDSLNLDYEWNVNGDEYDDASLWMKTAQRHNFGDLTVYDLNEGNFTYQFTFNVSSNPIEMTVPTYTYLYGDPASTVNVVGTLSPSIFEKDTYRNETTVQYVLYDKNGQFLQSGFGELLNTSYGFSIPVNTSKIGTDLIFENLADIVNEPEDLTEETNPSGSYQVVLNLRDSNDTIVAQASTTLVVTIDKDGDFITDDLEILYDKVIEDLDFSIHDPDTDNDGQADPVEYVIHTDKDGDGLPAFMEEEYGTSDNNPDSDGDGLTDGFGPYGELQLGTDGTDADTDGDGLKDGEEVYGWETNLITPKGLVITQVTSSPHLIDTDNDGVNDYYEFHFKIDPRNPDTDEDGLDDLTEQEYGTSLLNKDSDFDRIPDYDEVTRTFTATYYDAEGVELTQVYYLNPNSPDSDEDNITDYDEVYVYGSIGTNKDSDRDGINDYDEVFTYRTETNIADTDKDGLADGLEVQGFTIPVVIIYDGVYAEDGTVITEPQVNNYTITVTTDPLNPDTDGDGLTDWEEIMGDPSNVGDPTSADGDGDGIIDLLDPQRLVSDFAPAYITSDIDVVYSVRPSETTRKVVKYLFATLATLWNLMKDLIGWGIRLIGKLFYMKRVCFIICVRLPVLHSWSNIKRIVMTSIVEFAASHATQLFALADQFDQLLTNGLKLFGFGLELIKIAGIPVGLRFVGSIRLTAQNFVDTITGIVDPMVNFQFNIEDEAGIDKIILYRDGAKIKTIEIFGKKSYHFNEYFKVTKSGFTLGTTTLLFEIHDISGNVRMVQRTTSLKEFTSGILNQGITFIKETVQSIIKFAEQVWNWALEAVEFLGEKIVEAVNTIVNFTITIAKKVVDWVKAQFNKIWEGFIKDTLNFLLRDNIYAQRADTVLKSYSQAYQEMRPTIVENIDSFADPIKDAITDAADDIQDLMDEHLPEMDKDALTETLFSYIGPVYDFIDGTVLKYAIDILSGKAIEILLKAVQNFVDNLLSSIFGSYYGVIKGIIIDLFEQITLDLPPIVPITVDFGSAEGLVNTIVSTLDLLRNPADALKDMLAGLDGDYLMSFIDKFLVDNPEYLVSLNDIVFTMLKPALAIGIVFYDLLNFASSIFPGGQLLVYGLSNVKDLRGDIIKPSQIMLDQDWRYWVDWGLKTLIYVGKMSSIIFTEFNRVREMGDREPDKDVDWPWMLFKTAGEFIFLCITDIAEIVGGFISGKTLNFSGFDNNVLFKNIVVASLKLIVMVTSFVASLAPWKEKTELIVTWFFDICNWVIDAINAVWAITLAIIFGVQGELSVGKIVVVTMESLDTILKLIYEIAAAITNHGLKLASTGWGIVVYGIVAIVSVLLSGATATVGYIVDVFDL
jgi:hypothetical protein